MCHGIYLYIHLNIIWHKAKFKVRAPNVHGTRGQNNLLLQHFPLLGMTQVPEINLTYTQGRGIAWWLPPLPGLKIMIAKNSLELYMCIPSQMKCDPMSWATCIHETSSQKYSSSFSISPFCVHFKCQGLTLTLALSQRSGITWEIGPWNWT